ncbi:ABC transporter ATP-binding protein [Nakamurella lactea]|uniref:ABC transporter ATP-binding protein n=1 Tax=Nakamurella lactea TaxID=459515 RepID=UPI0004213915|nr:ABC transporter ATP-binding protein [Nakamurella lactea]
MRSRTTDEPAGRTAAKAVVLQGIGKTYGRGRRTVTALDSVDLAFARGSFTAVMGPSGSGKSTLLHCAAGLDRPSGGEVLLDGIRLSDMREKDLTVLRRERLGFVFQSFNLLPALTTAQNVALPLRLAGRRTDRPRLAAVLASVGLADQADRRPAELSGGQQQRVAIARTLITEPAVIFADEPTGALDTRSAAEVLTLLTQVVRGAGRTVVMVTHDPVAASYADRVVFLADGRVADELFAPTADAIADRMVHLGAWAAPGLQQADPLLPAAGGAR